MIGIFSALIQTSSETYTGVVTPVAIAIFFFLLACVTTVILGYNYQAPLPSVEPAAAVAGSVDVRSKDGKGAQSTTDPAAAINAIELQSLSASPDDARSSSPLVAIHIDPSVVQKSQKDEEDHEAQSAPTMQVHL